MEGMTGTDLVGPVAAQHEQRGLVGPTQQVPEELDGRRGRPLEVVEHEHDGLVHGQPLDQGHDRLEQLEAVRGATVLHALAATGGEQRPEGTGARGDGPPQLVVDGRDLGEGEGEEDEGGDVEDDLMAVSNFPLCSTIRERIKQSRQKSR